VFLDLSRELLRRGYSVRFRPKGFSMHPTIRDGEAVTVAPTTAHAIKRGDILLYQTKRGVTAHRVVEIRERGQSAAVFILRGDSLASCDAPVRGEQILGKVISVERKGREVNLTGRRAAIRRAARVCARGIKRGLNFRLGFVRLFL
jgi:signal peptidase I